MFQNTGNYVYADLGYNQNVNTCEFVDEINSLFNKKFQFAPHPRWKLPDPTTLFTTIPWKIQQLEALKQRLNFHKSQLNDFNIEEWSVHTRRRNPAGEVGWKVRCTTNPEFLTQAWTKFYECAYTYDIVPREAVKERKMVSLHLCEAPGAFITSLNHYMKLRHQYVKFEWHWVGSTLNPYYEGNSMSNMINDDRFMFHTLHNWEFGADNTGNLMDWNNSQTIINRAKTLGKVMLVTADGSIDCLERPDAQEEMTSPLHYCEIVTALQALCQGGTLIFKLFTMYEHTTVNLLCLVNRLFESVNIFKPVTSREGNSEVYAICLQFNGENVLDQYIPILKSAYGTDLYKTRSLFPLGDIPQDFLKQIYECAEYFCEKQCAVIDGNLEAYFLPASNRDLMQIKRFKSIVGGHFIKHYRLYPITYDREILKGVIHEWNRQHNTNPRYHRGSYTERQLYDTLSVKEKLVNLMSFLQCDVLSDSNIFLTGPVEWLSLYDEKADINVIFTYGIPLRKLNSSKFIFVPILKLYQNILDETQFTNLLSIKDCFSGPSHNVCNVTCKILSISEFDSTETYDLYEKKWFTKIYDTLNSLEEGASLKINNFNLLTHFNVGIVYILCYKCFEKIGFMEDNTVVLHNLINKSELEYLSFIQKAIKNVQSENKSILSVLPVSMTDFGIFYEKVVVYNNTFFKNKCMKYLCCIEEIINNEK